MVKRKDEPNQDAKKELNSQKNEIPKKQEEDTLQYKLGDKILKFQFLSEKRVNCPICNSSFKNILNDLKKSSCKLSNLDDFSNKFKQFTKEYLQEEVKKKQRERKSKSRAKQRDIDIQKELDDQNI